MNIDGKTDASPLELATPSNIIGNPNDRKTQSDKGIISDLSKKENKLKTENNIENLEKELNILKSYSPKYNIKTRSQNKTEHVQLTFEPKPKQNKKMAQNIDNAVELKANVTLKLEEAFKLIPKCSGEDDIYQFINACDLAVNSVAKEHAPILTRYITTKLSGKAVEIIKYKDTSEWIYIKQYLENAFQSPNSANSLQLQLHSIKMNQGETIKSYNERIEQIFYKLLNIYTTGTPESEAKIIQKQLQSQILASYIKGLIKPIKVMVKASKPTTLGEAEEIAKSEESDFIAEKETNLLFNRPQNNNYNANNRNNFGNGNAYQSGSNYANNNGFDNNRYRKPIKCYKCNGPHFTNQCRANQVQRSNFTPPNNNNGYNNNYRQPNSNNFNNNYRQNNNRPPNNFNNFNPRNSNNYTRPPTNYNTYNSTCNYCNKRGHDIADCYTKKRNDERNNNNSGNERADAARGPRTVNQITAEGEEIYNDASTSYQE